MSVKDTRRPPFAWFSLEGTARIRAEVIVGQQDRARSAYMALAEGASRRFDGRHEGWATLAEVALIAGVTQRRMRARLQLLVPIGLVRIEERKDPSGKSLPARYLLLDARPERDSGADEVSAPDESSAPDDLGAKSSDPTRASGREEQEGSGQGIPSNPDVAGEGDDVVVAGHLNEVVAVLESVAARNRLPLKHDKVRDALAAAADANVDPLLIAEHLVREIRAGTRVDRCLAGLFRARCRDPRRFGHHPPPDAVSPPSQWPTADGPPRRAFVIAVLDRVSGVDQHDVINAVEFYRYRHPSASITLDDAARLTSDWRDENARRAA